jgi:luciferase family oxidoreductase group 1
MSLIADSTVQVGVLDQSPIPEGSSAGQALRNSLELARLADGLGYNRYWLAEHHGTPGLACASPEVMIGQVAQVTSNIRVGSGGIMLPHYSPLKVAESFSMLAGMYPGRIDLGVGRAAGTSPGVAFALQRDRRQRAPDDFPEQFGELLSYFSDPGTPGGPFPQIARSLPAFAAPDPFLLGSSLQSAVWAAELGLPYVFADFINARGAENVEYYRERFTPSQYLQKPHVMVAVWVICAETDEEALRLSASSRMMMTLLHQGKLIAVPPVETALEFLKRNGLPPDTLPPGRRFVTGSPDRVRSQLGDVAREYGKPDELLLVNIMYSHTARMESYRLAADALGLISGPELAEKHHDRLTRAVGNRL